jgi:hypothetical protein
MANKRAFRLQTIGDISHCLKKTINQVGRGEMNVQEARTIGYLCNILYPTIKDMELVKRLEDIHKMIEEVKQERKQLKQNLLLQKETKNGIA